MLTVAFGLSVQYRTSFAADATDTTTTDTNGETKPGYSNVEELKKLKLEQLAKEKADKEASEKEKQVAEEAKIDEFNLCQGDLDPEYLESKLVIPVETVSTTTATNATTTSSTDTKTTEPQKKDPAEIFNMKELYCYVCHDYERDQAKLKVDGKTAKTSTKTASTTDTESQLSAHCKAAKGYMKAIAPTKTTATVWMAVGGVCTLSCFQPGMAQICQYSSLGAGVYDAVQASKVKEDKNALAMSMAMTAGSFFLGGGMSSAATAGGGAKQSAATAGPSPQTAAASCDKPATDPAQDPGKTPEAAKPEDKAKTASKKKNSAKCLLPAIMAFARGVLKQQNVKEYKKNFKDEVELAMELKAEQENQLVIDPSLVTDPTLTGTASGARTGSRMASGGTGGSNVDSEMKFADECQKAIDRGDGSKVLYCAAATDSNIPTDLISSKDFQKGLKDMKLNIGDLAKFQDNKNAPPMAKQISALSGADADTANGIVGLGLGEKQRMLAEGVPDAIYFSGGKGKTTENPEENQLDMASLIKQFGIGGGAEEETVFGNATEVNFHNVSRTLASNGLLDSKSDLFKNISAKYREYTPSLAGGIK